jgi:integral membrane protein
MVARSDSPSRQPATAGPDRLVAVLGQLRLVAVLEGASFLVLLFVAMPLKYLAGLPLAVRIAGSIHGVLFIWFVVALYRAARALSWPRRRSMTAFVASILPFGTFVFDASLRRELESLRTVNERAPA